MGKKIVDFVSRIQRLPGVGAGLAPVLEGQAVCRPSHLGGVYFLVCVFVGVVALIGSIVAILRCRFSLIDRKSTRLNSSHVAISYAVFCLNNKKHTEQYYCDYRIADRLRF